MNPNIGKQERSVVPVTSPLNSCWNPRDSFFFFEKAMRSKENQKSDQSFWVFIFLFTKPFNFFLRGHFYFRPTAKRTQENHSKRTTGLGHLKIMTFTFCTESIVGFGPVVIFQRYVDSGNRETTFMAGGFIPRANDETALDGLW